MVVTIDNGDPMELIHRDWGKRIVRGRRALGLSQGALAKALGVSQQTVSRWETGDGGPKDEHKILIASALRQEPGELFPLPRVLAR